jgi:hypothetical protein
VAAAVGGSSRRYQRRCRQRSDTFIDTFVEARNDGAHGNLVNLVNGAD